MYLDAETFSERLASATIPSLVGDLDTHQHHGQQPAALTNPDLHIRVMCDAEP
jgi:hypothetical protein